MIFLGEAAHKSCQSTPIICMISGIMQIHVLNKPADTLTGLKWQETREMFEKEATETIWITESVEKEHYCTRAESHGSIYVTRVSVKSSDSGTKISMTFSGTPQTFMAKTMSFLMGSVINKSIKKH